MSEDPKRQPWTGGGAAEEDDEDLSLDLKQLDTVRELLQLMARTVSAMKIFPSDHASVRTFVDELARRLMEFLDKHEKLELAVEENALTCLGKPVFKDDSSVKSLPFSFFKDGMRSLTFYRGVERDEIFEFLELIKREGLKPADEGDIVNALWERDFSSIQYTAPDDYIEQRIIEERMETLDRRGMSVLPQEFASQVVDVKVDRERLASGRLELLADDRAALEAAAGGAAAATPDAAAPAIGADAGLPGLPEELTQQPALGLERESFTEEEATAIETLVQANRSISAEEEFLNLMVELIYLEADLGQAAVSLDVLAEYHLEHLQKGAFQQALFLVRRMGELAEHERGPNPAKAARIDAFLAKARGPSALEAVRDYFQGRPAATEPAAFDFLRLLGPDAYILAADLYEDNAAPDFRASIMEFLNASAAGDPGLLAGLAADNRPDFTRASIRALAAWPDRKASQHLAAFLAFRSRDLRLEAVSALGTLRDDVANRVLMGFLADPAEEVRIQAALRLDRMTDRTKLRQFIADAASRKFRQKGLEERRAIFGFLGRTQAPEAFEFLSQVLRKRLWWPSLARLEQKVCAVEGLEAMGTAEAFGIIEKGARARHRLVREAALRALERRAPAGGTA